MNSATRTSFLYPALLLPGKNRACSLRRTGTSGGLQCLSRSCTAGSMRQLITPRAVAQVMGCSAQAPFAPRI